jgi:hypothetical protein
MAITKFLDPKNDVAFRRIFGSETANPNMSYIPVTEYFNAAIIQK